MGIRFRKSIKLGGFRINLSKSGIGYSYGAKGFRVTRKAGGGSRYTASIPGTGISYVKDSKKRERSSAQAVNTQRLNNYSNDIAVESDLVATTQNEFVEALNKRYKIKSLFRVLRIFVLIAGFAGDYLIYDKYPHLFILAYGLAVLGILGFLLLSLRMPVKLDFVFEYSLFEESYKRLVDSYKPLNSISRIFAIGSFKIKRDAALVTPKKINISKKSKAVKSDIPIVSLLVQKDEIIFLPQIIAAFQNGQWFAIEWADLKIDFAVKQFIEASPASDTKVVEKTYKYTTKTGKPDKRYKDNPIMYACEYGCLELSSSNGLSVILLFSNVEKAQIFASALQEMVDFFIDHNNPDLSQKKYKLTSKNIHTITACACKMCTPFLCLDMVLNKLKRDFVHTTLMKKKFFVLISVVVVLFALNLDSTKSILESAGKAIYPAFVGVFFALLFNAPVQFMEKTFLSSPKLGKFKRILSLGITLLLFAGVIGIIGYLIVPELGKSFETLKAGLEGFASGGGVFSSLLGKENALTVALDKIAAAGEKLIKDSIPDIAAFAMDAIKETISILLGLALGVMMLASKESLAKNLYGIIDSCFDEKNAALFKGALAAAVDKFSRFLGGQAIEGLIFGTACYLTLLLFKVPYALLAAVVAAVGNLVPTIGSYLGGIIGFLIVLTVSPGKALVFVAVVIVLQQIEQFTTYPVIVGKYVGLSSYYVLLAVVVGGGLFGFWGLVLGVPVTAFVYNLVSVIVKQKPKEIKVE